MTITIESVLDAQDEIVSPFPSNLYSNGQFIRSVNNTQFEKIGTGLPYFDDNGLYLYKGNDAGIFLVVTHQGEAVHLIESFESMDDYHDYMEKVKSALSDFNWDLKDEPEFIAYYIIHHQYTNPKKPDFHYLLKFVNDLESFHALYACYESLYNKERKYKNCSKRKILVASEFIADLTKDERSLLSFSLFTKGIESNFSCNIWIKTIIEALPELKAGAFNDFGIEDDKIDRIFRYRKMHLHYFVSIIREGKEKKSIYYIDNYTGEVGSYLSPADELVLWRNGDIYGKYAAENYESVAFEYE